MYKHSKIYHNPKGLTLVELLVATAIVGIVMIGTASVDYAIRSSHIQSYTNSIINSRLSSAMVWLATDANLAIGENGNVGIVYDDNNGDVSQHVNICFRHDTDNIPNTYTGDTWVCYYQMNEDINENTNYTIYRCDNLINSFTGWGWINPAYAQIGNSPASCTPTEILQSYQSDFFNVEETGGFQYVEFNLSSRKDNNPAAATHPIKNPAYQMSSRFNPPGVSR